MSKFRPYILAETNWKATQNTNFDLAILPWGATEAHNYHLPYATDNFQAEAIAIESAKRTWAQQIQAVVLPTIPYGVNTGQLDINLCMNMNPSTQMAILSDIIDVLGRHKVHKLVIMNSHGGNHFKQMIRELHMKFPDVFVCSVNWYHISKAHDLFEEPGDHAGEMETSLIMHLHPELVLPISEAGDGKAKKFKIKGFNEGWASAQRQWTKITKDTGVGNPQHATAIKGANCFNLVCEEISHFLIELGKTSIQDLYE